MAIADREFSGKFMIRIPPELHRQLAIDAAEQHVSLNRLVSSRLIGVSLIFHDGPVWGWSAPVASRLF